MDVTGPNLSWEDEAHKATHLFTPDRDPTTDCKMDTSKVQLGEIVSFIGLLTVSVTLTLTL